MDDLKANVAGCSLGEIKAFILANPVDDEGNEYEFHQISPLQAKIRVKTPHRAPRYFMVRVSEMM